MSAQSLSCVQLFATPWTTLLQAPLYTGLPRQEYWSGLPFSPPGYLPDHRIRLIFPVSLALEGRFFTTEPSVEAPIILNRAYLGAMQGFLGDSDS